MKTTYLALTIGPIVKTLLNTRRTLELWGASYLFSRLIRDIICNLLRQDGIRQEDIILPSPHLFKWDDCPPKWNPPFNDSEKDKIKELGAGLFPDRLYLRVKPELKTEMINKVQKAANEALKNLATLIEQVNGNRSFNYLKQYFQIYFIQKDLSEKENIIFTLSPLLDTLELQSNFPLEDDTNPIKNFLRDINESDQLISEAFSQRYHPAHPGLSDVERFGFDSLVEIAAREFGYLPDTKTKFSELLTNYLRFIDVLKDENKNTETETNDETKNKAKDEFIKEKEFLKQLNSDQETRKFFRTYHKYIAIVTADGDNMGKILKQIGNDPEKIKQFSQKLTEFSARAVLMIHQYGGAPVYAGGDDLLFFAPVSMVQVREPDDPAGYHILHLLEKLDKKFRDSMKDYLAFKPSLSFGVSITYYAFPMGESLEQSRNLLFGTAKQVKGKNAVALTIQKHSGNQFGGIYRLDAPSFELFRRIMNHDPKQDDEMEQLKSVMYKLRNNEGLVEQIGKDEIRVQNFIENSFNESIHRDAYGNLIPYLKWVSELIPAIYNEIDDVKDQLQGDTDAEKSMNQLYGMLRTVSFLKGEEL